jgi:luciferase family oxidoreductase group 1
MAMAGSDLNSIPFSILDLATVARGQTYTEVFKNSLDLAKHAELLGYTRYWFAEHHNMISVASSATAVLIGHIASGTKTIRVGSGGIMLPNHSPLIVAEQFGTLASIYPGRIDLGLGRAPGTDQVTAKAIRGENFETVHSFPRDVKQLQLLFSTDNAANEVRAIPGEGLDIPIWILGSSTDSAKLAAAMGLPYAFASHFAPTYFEKAIAIYRENFRASEKLSEPYILACVNAVAADTDQQANYLATSVQQFFMGVVTGKRDLLPPPVESMEGIWTIYEEEAIKQMLRYSFIGGPETIRKDLSAFIAKYQVNEVMATSHIFDHSEKLKSYEIFAGVLRG